MILRLFSFVLIAYALGFCVFLLAMGRPDDERRTDAIVVVTGGPGRIDRGIELLAERRARRMLVSGVDPSVRPRELAAQHPGSRRWFDCCIDLGQEAIDTRSNGEETAAWVRQRGYASVRLVTADWHMPRARMELANALGPDVSILGDRVQTQAGLGVLFSEYNKLLIRRIALWAGYDAR
ncbi:YdcF family protein [Sphingomonas sp.]